MSVLQTTCAGITSRKAPYMPSSGGGTGPLAQGFPCLLFANAGNIWETFDFPLLWEHSMQGLCQ